MLSSLSVGADVFCAYCQFLCQDFICISLFNLQYNSKLGVIILIDVATETWNN